MSVQNRANHTRWDPPFHFFVFPFLVATFLFSIKHAFAYPNGMTIWLVVLCVALVVWAFRTRIYALRVQDRLIRLEERLRMEHLAPIEVAARFEELTVKQIVALRFASDGELAQLTQRALDEKLDPKQIKAAIVTWRPDTFRV